MADAQISRDIARFRDEQPFYDSVRDELDKFKEILIERGISHEWHSRVKKPESLEEKLKKRHERGEDSSIANIKDLVGGRIVLPTNRQLEAVKSLISEHFDVVEDPIQHPTPKEHEARRGDRFRGYDGLHYRIQLKSEDERKSNVAIEIQVVDYIMSIFHNAEHDVRYKGDNILSKRIYDALEILQGTTHNHAVAYDQFQEAIEDELRGHIYPGNDSASHPFSMYNNKSLEDMATAKGPNPSLDQQENLIEKLLSMVANAARG